MMNRLVCFLAVFPALAFPALAADQVVLTNGDTITGAIVGKDGGKLTIKSEFLGDVTMPWSAVKSLRSDAELTVVLPSGETVKGKIATVDSQLQVAAGTATRSAPLGGVAAIRDTGEQEHYERMLHPGILDLWTGNFDIGLSLARGNARTDTLTTAFTADRTSRNDKIALYFNQLYGTARIGGLTSTIASAVRGGWKYNRNVSPRMFLSVFDDYERDRFQNLKLRLVAGGGAGVKAVKAEHTQLDFDAGLDYQRENFLDLLHRNSAEANFGDSLLHQMTKSTSITQSMRVFTNLSDAGSYRVNFDLSGSVRLKKWLGWQLTGSDRFLSNPVQGRQRNDLLISTGFRLTFAR